MSLSSPPNQPPPLPQPAPLLTWKARIIRECSRWANLPRPRFGLLVLSIGLLIFLSPPLPFVAYALWLWASSSWAWRDRWASIWALAWRGGAFVAVVLLVAALSSAHIWIFPQLTATLQAFWCAHLPGELSLTPIFDPLLLARMLLLLPLAPALALYFEKIDPRTRVQQQRILTARAHCLTTIFLCPLQASLFLQCCSDLSFWAVASLITSNAGEAPGIRSRE